MKATSLFAAALLALATATPAFPQSSEQCRSTKAVPARSVLVAALARKDIAKGEFESSPDYEARMAKVVASLGVVRLAAPMSKEWGKYDADSETFTITPNALPRQFDDLEDYWLGGATDHREWYGQLVGGTAADTGHYTAQNAYGVKRRVVKLKRVKLEVVFEGGEKFQNGSGPLILPLPRKEAQKRLGHLVEVVAGVVASPFVVDGSHAHDPTIYDPIESETKLRGLVIAPVCGAIVDGLNGEVLATFDPAKITTYYIPF